MGGNYEQPEACRQSRLVALSQEQFQQGSHLLNWWFRFLESFQFTCPQHLKRVSEPLLACRMTRYPTYRQNLKPFTRGCQACFFRASGSRFLRSTIDS